jgi:hypothetical protein
VDLIHTFYPDNGGNSGSGYSDPWFVSPYNSEAHSALACRQDSQHRLLSVPQYQRLLALFTVFKYVIIEIIRQENLLSSSLADMQIKDRTSRRNPLTLTWALPDLVDSVNVLKIVKIQPDPLPVI